MRQRIEALLGSECFWFCAALAVRAGFAVHLGDRMYQADEIGYDSVAWNWARFGFIGNSEGPMVVSPGAPFFFGVFYKLGHHLLYARLGQAVLSAATAVLLGRMTRDLTDSKRAGLWATAVASIYPFFIYYSGMLMSESVYLAASIGGLWALCKSLRENGTVPWRAAVAGALLAYAALTRSAGTGIGAVLWLGTAGLCLSGRYAWRSWLLGVLCWLLPLFGWAARNQSFTGVYSLDLHGGYTFLIGVRYFDLNEMDTLYADQAFKLTPLYREAQALSEVERDRLYFRETVRWMKEHPAEIMRQGLHKAFNFWRFYPRVDKEYPHTATAKPDAGVSRALMVLVSLCFEPALILGGFWGAWRLRERWRDLFPLYWLILGTFGLHTIVISQMRYRLPVMPLLIFFLCAAIDRRSSSVEGPHQNGGT